MQIGNNNDELQQMDQRTRKLMTMLEALHPRDDRDYIKRKEGRRGLTSIEDSIDILIQQFEDSIKKSVKKDLFLWPEVTQGSTKE